MAQKLVVSIRFRKLELGPVKDKRNIGKLSDKVLKDFIPTH
jgi:hypothetical protein